MCILALAWRADPRWRLVAVANRDELHARPSAPLGRWADRPQLIAGRDLQSGGTWLGVSEQGRFAAVTNLRGFGPPSPERASRGTLMTDLLSHEGRYADPDDTALDDFNPFNAIVADARAARFLSNRPTPVQRHLPPGLYGMSNGPLDEPWPKTARLKDRLAEWMATGGHVETLFDDLRDGSWTTDDPTPAADAPQAPIFVLNPVYGTRCSTVVAIDAEGRGLIAERRYGPDGAPTGDTQLTFRWPG